jgi:hypothetical protein
MNTGRALWEARWFRAVAVFSWRSSLSRQCPPWWRRPSAKMLVDYSYGWRIRSIPLSRGYRRGTAKCTECKWACTGMGPLPNGLHKVCASENTGSRSRSCPGKARLEERADPRHLRRRAGRAMSRRVGGVSAN